MVVLREGDVHFKGVAGLVADDLLLKALDEVAGAEDQRIVLALSAFKRHAVHAAVEVDLHSVAVLGSSVFHGDKAGVLVLLLADSFVDIRFGDFHVSLLDFDPLVLAQGHFRTDCHGAGVDKVLAGAYFCDIDLRTGDDLKTALLAGFRPGLVDASVDSALIEHALTVDLLDHILRRVALAESGELKFSLVLVISFFNSLAELVVRDGDRDDCHVLFFFLHLEFHCNFLLQIVSFSEKGHS